MRHVLTLIGMFLLNSILIGQNNDCNLAAVLCNNVNITSNPDGAGFDDFLTDNNSEGCLAGGEHESEWYYFQIDDNAPSDLEIGFIITPNAGLGEDYDFSIYGPNKDCNSLGSPIRCSYAATGCANCPNTGLDSDALDNFEGASGDGIVAPLIVQPGEGYFLLIDNFLSTGQGFDMNWTGAASSWLDCTAQPPCSVEAIVGNDFIACQGVGTLSLAGNNPGQNFTSTYNWSSNGIGNSFISTPDSQNTSLNIPPNFSGILNYTLTVVDGSCSDASNIQITIGPTPQLILPFSTDFCLNEPAFAFPISPEGGTWSNGLPNGIVDPVALGVGNHVATYSYTDQVTGCNVEENISFSIIEAPAPVLDPISTTCIGENFIQLNATPLGGTWSTNAPNGIFNPSSVSPGTHSIEYTILDSNTGCIATSTQSVEVLEEVNIQIEGNTVFCIGGNTTISVNPNYDTYLWSDGSTGTSITTTSSNTFTVTVTNIAGCTSTDQVNVVEDDNFPIADAGNNLTLDCAFNFISIGGNSSLGNMTYEWTSTDPNLTINANDNIQAAVNQAGIYQLMVTNIFNGCTTLDEVSVFENTNFPTNANFDIEPLICYGDQDAILTISNIQNGTPPYSYSINQGNFQNNNTFTYLGSDTYSVIIQDVNFCEYETEVFIPTPPEFQLNIGEDFVISLGQDAELLLQPNYNLSSFEWQADSTLSCFDCFNPTISPQFQTTYFVSATSEEGCYTEEFITVYVEKNRNVFIPNAFSPNEDGQNDIFKIYGGPDVLTVNSFYIFNRWGEILYQASDFNVLDDKIGWDGFLKGKKMPTGVYIYTAEIEFIDGWKEVYKGDLTLTK